MNVNEVRELLALIEGTERVTIPASALEVWHTALGKTAFEDAKAAVEKHYRMSPVDGFGNLRKIMPNDVKRVAEDFHTTRMRALARQALAGREPKPGESGSGALTGKGLAAREMARAVAAEAAERARARRTELVAA